MVNEAQKDILVKTANPEALDRTVQELGAVVLESEPGIYEQVQPGVYAVRSFSGAHDFIRFALEKQGYAEVVGDRPWDLDTTVKNEVKKLERRRVKRRSRWE